MPELDGYVLRSLLVSDVEQCADLHRRAFPDFFLSQLGGRFLRHFYGAFVRDVEAVSLVAEDSSGRILGVVVGTVKPSGFFKRLLLRRWYAFACSSVMLVLRRPRAVLRLLGALTYRGGAPTSDAGALLSSICTDPDGPRGLGQRLLRGFTDTIVVRGVRSAYLTTDAVGNERVNNFYRRAGWRLDGTFITREKRKMNYYVWERSDAVNHEEATN